MSSRDNSVKVAFDDSLYSLIKETLERYAMDTMLSKGVLVGLSGGADSVMLLTYLVEYKRREALDFKIAACHVNHLIRGDEALRDMEFSESFAKSLQVEFIPVTVDVPQYAKDHKLGIEEAARKIRYAEFDKIISSRNDLSCVALAHNASDNLETVIFNMMRGAGISGISGIPPVRDNIVRPLIRISKKDILEFLDYHGINYVTDSTNFEIDYSRNYIRHEIVPRLFKLSPDPESSVSRLTESLYFDNAFITLLAENTYKSLKTRESFDISALRELDYPILTRIISFLVSEYVGSKPSMQLVKDIISCLSSDNFLYSIGRGYSILCELGKISVVRDSAMQCDGKTYPLCEGLNELPDYDALIVIGDKKQNISSNIYNFSIHVDVPFDIINNGLCFRFRREGDSYRYGGITHKLKKVFNDRAIPPSVRDRIPIICDNYGILWVPGLPLREGVNLNKTKTVRITLFYSTDNKKNRRIYTANRE